MDAPLRILVVSPCFPPDLKIGALRMGSLCAYLVARGWDVTVMRALHPENGDRPSVAGVRLIQVDTQHIYPTVKGKAAKVKRNKENAAGKVYRAALEELLARERFDAMLVSMDPFFNMRLAIVAKRHGLPCVLDFRDPGALAVRELQHIHGVQGVLHRFYRLALHMQERAAVRAASRVVLVTPGWRKLYEDAYHTPPGKTVMICNGYDEEKLRDVALADRPAREAGAPFTLACFGKLAFRSDEYAEHLLRAVKEVNDGGVPVRILHIGGREKNIDAIIQRAGVSDALYECVPFMEYAPGMRRVSEQDALVTIDIRRDAIGTKIYDYIYLNRPLLFVGPKEAEQHRMVSAFEHGYAASTQQEVASALRAMAAGRFDHLQDGLDVRAYSREPQNERFARLLTEAARETSMSKGG